MKRVVHVFGSMDTGGAELRTLELMERLRPHGIVFDFVTLSGREGSLAPQIRSLGGQVYPMRIDAAWPVRLPQLLRRLQPSAVDSHVATFSGAVLAAARVAGVPRRIAHFRSDGDLHGDSPRRRAQRGLMRKLIHLNATDIVGVSPGALTHGYRSDWSADPRARVIANGVAVGSSGSDDDLRASIGLREFAPVIAHVGRPSAEKNRPRLVPIFDALRMSQPDAQLVLVGGRGQDEAALTHALGRSSNSVDVVDLGRRTDARAIMAAADVVVLPSVREGLPGVVLEALSVGTPVVASNLPGTRWIAEQTSGLSMHDLKDPDAAWADTLNRLICDAPARSGVRDAFARSIFTIERATQDNARLYGGEE